MRALAVVLLLLLAAPAAAQAPAGAWTLALSGAAPGEVRPDAALPVAVEARLTGSNLLCPADAEVPLAVVSTPTRPVEGLLLEFDPPPAIPVPRGLHTDATPFDAGATLVGRLLVARFAAQGQEGVFRVTVSADVAAAGCVPEPEAPATAELEVRTRVAALPESDPLHHPSHEEHGDSFDAYLGPGERVSRTFTAPGRYTYHDHLDPARKGEVHVLRSANESAATVRITSAGYAPDRVVVAVGGTVTWVNEDARTRTVSQDEAHGVSELEPTPRPRDVTASGESPAETPLPPLALPAFLAAALLLGSAARGRARR